MRYLLPLVLVIAVVTAVAQPLTALKPLYPRTEICMGGKPRALVVLPDGECPAAGAFLSAVEKATGVKLESLPASRLVSEEWQVDFARLAGRNIVALGNINNNRLLAVLWGKGYANGDSIFPGPGGYILRTIHDPFANGSNVLALTGSDADGLLRAVQVFVDKHVTGRDVVLAQPLLEVQSVPVPKRFYPAPADSLSSKRQPQYSGLDYFRQYLQDLKLMDAEGKVASCPDGNAATVTGAIARLAQTWFWNGNPELPPLMKQILDANRPLLSVMPRRVEMEPGTAAHVRWWDLVEELPVWTDQDRLDLANALLADARQGHEKRAVHDMVKDGMVQVVDENHGTNAAQNDYLAWQYFDRYYKLPESKYWMQVASATYLGQAASHQVLEDASGYLCYCPIDAMEHAFAEGDLTYLKRGIALGHAEYIAQACVNNLGLASGFGDDGSLVEPGLYEAIAPAAWYYCDPRLSWVARNLLPQACGLRTFTNAIPVNLDIPEQEPTDWTGLSIFPIFKQTLRKGQGSKTPVFDPRESVGSEWFNKAVFRDRWSPDAQYLLLDGSGKFGTPEGYPNGPAGHMHNDVNTIINYTDQGRMWLVDHTYSTRSIQDHSGLYIVRNGEVGYQVHEAKLRAAAESPTLALTTSTFEGFSGADWERTIFWQRGRRFIVIDRALAREPGDYVVRCSYRALGDPTLDGPSLKLTQSGKSCTITSDGRARLDVVDFAMPNPDEWKSAYPHCAPIARIFQQDKSAHLEPGQFVSFINVIEAGASAPQVTLKPLSAASALIEKGGTRALCGVGPIPGGTGETTAFVVERERALLTGLTRLGPAGEPLLQVTGPVTLSMEDWSLSLECPQPVTVTVTGEKPVQLAAGHQALADGAALIRRFLQQRLSEADALAAAYTANAAKAGAGEVFGLRTSPTRLDSAVAAVTTADLTGDGEPEWLTAASDGIRAYDGTKLLWHVASPSPCGVIAAADLNADGKVEVVTGTAEGQVRALDAQGKELWAFTCKPTRMPTQAVDWLRIADLDADGKPEVIVGAAWLHCLDGAGQLKWEKYLCLTRGAITGNFEQADIADIDGDGKLEIAALFNYSYPKALIFDCTGKVIVPAAYDNDRNPGLNIDSPQVALLLPLRGAGTPPNLLVGGPSYLHCFWAVGPYAEKFAGRKAGCFTHLAFSQPAGEPPILLAATDLGLLHAYRAVKQTDEALELSKLWTADAGDRISALSVADNGRVLIGGKTGTVQLLDALTGRPLGRTAATGSRVVQFLTIANTPHAVHADGLIESVSLAN
ncbi:MAG: hypothetical protein ABFE07_27010 [Armatimonadia bacterium]